jgi:hypothetical protein
MRLRAEALIGGERQWSFAARVTHGQGQFSVPDVDSLRARVAEVAESPHPITRIALTWRVPGDKVVVTVFSAPKIGLEVIAEHADQGIADAVADFGLRALEPAAAND